ncbi:redoxin domain-containing protein [Mariniblastus fucicola]|uniref:AhpC/TSA family protein n=1 Tax=Mariniblastus fucicola TaxID=980251 RepID=A0A5B9PDT6_9BACT|nr:redoxin domain-containing protein [Mariniblastus fucicola]QEG24568.1 AhpC/TSA family protein [Mariniblastus fucicola]
MELEALQSNLQTILDRGAALIAFCPQLQHFNQSITKELGLGFPVLQDVNNQIATSFGLTVSTPPDVIEAERSLGLELPETNGTDHWDLPMPSRFVIGRGGEIRFASVHADHRLRSEPEECLDFIGD